MASYDPSIVERFAQALYDRAGTVVFAHTALYAAVAGGAGLIGVSTLAGLVAALIGGAIGYDVGQQKAFALKLQAQTALCQVQIERNTRPGDKADGAVIADQPRTTETRTQTVNAAEPAVRAQPGRSRTIAQIAGRMASDARLPIDEKVELLRLLGGEFAWDPGALSKSCTATWEGQSHRFSDGAAFGRWMAEAVLPKACEVAEMPLGRCPSCERRLPLVARTCPVCQADFGPHSSWKVGPAA